MLGCFRGLEGSYFGFQAKVFLGCADKCVISSTELRRGDGMKYELLPENDKYRLRALKSFADVKAGDLGGLVSRASNLSQDGNCWVYYDSRALNDAKVQGNAVVRGTARIYNSAVIKDQAVLEGNARVGGNVVVGDTSYINLGSTQKFCLFSHGRRDAVTMLDNGLVFIGKTGTHVNTWLKEFDTFAEANGYSDRDKEFYVTIFDHVIEHIL